MAKDCPRENNLVRGIMTYLKQRPDTYAFKTHGSAITSGLPDIIACVDGKFYAFEVKTPQGRVTKLQKATMAQMQKANASTYVVYGVKDVREILEGS